MAFIATSLTEENQDRNELTVSSDLGRSPISFSRSSLVGFDVQRLLGTKEEVQALEARIWSYASLCFFTTIDSSLSISVDIVADTCSKALLGSLVLGVDNPCAYSEGASTNGD